MLPEVKKKQNIKTLIFFHRMQNAFKTFQLKVSDKSDLTFDGFFYEEFAQAESLPSLF